MSSTPLYIISAASWAMGLLVLFVAESLGDRAIAAALFTLAATFPVVLGRERRSPDTVVSPETARQIAQDVAAELFARREQLIAPLVEDSPGQQYARIVEYLSAIFNRIVRLEQHLPYPK